METVSTVNTYQATVIDRHKLVFIGRTAVTLQGEQYGLKVVMIATLNTGNRKR